jgi:hypothetical protein
MIMPTFIPEGTEGPLTFKITKLDGSSATDVARLIDNGGGAYSIEGLKFGEARVTATTQNGKSAYFNITVLSALTSAAISTSSYTMEVNTYWDVPVSASPTNGYADYTIESMNPGVVRVEFGPKEGSANMYDGFAKVYAVRPGTTTLALKNAEGTFWSYCSVTVNPVKPGWPSVPGDTTRLKFYSVTRDSGSCTVELGVVPVTGAYSYRLTYHHNYTLDMQTGTGPGQLHEPGNIGGEPMILYEDDVKRPVRLKKIPIGLRFFSIEAYDKNGKQLGDTFVGRYGITYGPVVVGGTGPSATDGLVVPTMVSSLVDGYFVNQFVDPFGMDITFERIPSVAGYDIIGVNNGALAFQGNIPSSGSGARIKYTALGLQSGTTTVYLMPYIYDIDKTTKLYSGIRTCNFVVGSGAFGSPGCYYWETAATYNSPEITFVIPVSGQARAGQPQ